MRALRDDHRDAEVVEANPAAQQVVHRLQRGQARRPRRLGQRQRHGGTARPGPAPSPAPRPNPPRCRGAALPPAAAAGSCSPGRRGRARAEGAAGPGSAPAPLVAEAAVREVPRAGCHGPPAAPTGRPL